MEYSPRLHQGLVRIGKIFVFMIAFAHFSACMWYFCGEVTSQGDELDELSWISRLDVDITDQSQAIKYMYSLYYAICTLTTVGYGDVVPRTEPEIVFAITMMLIGALFICYITATVSSVLHDFDIQAFRYRAKMTNLIKFIRNSELSPELQKRLMHSMSGIWKDNPYENDPGSLRELREEMPRQIAYEVALEFHGDLINSSSFFALFVDEPREHQFVGEVVHELKPFMSYDGEFVGNVGDSVNKWVIINSGSVVALSPLDSELELMYWSDGDSFGEVGIFLTQHWGWNMRCCEDCIFYGIDTRVFLSILAHHRSVSQKLVRIAGERILRMQKTKHRLLKMQNAKRRASRAAEKDARISGLHYRLRNMMEEKQHKMQRSLSHYVQKEKAKRQARSLSQEEGRQSGIKRYNSTRAGALAGRESRLTMPRHHPKTPMTTAKERWAFLRNTVRGRGRKTVLQTMKAVADAALEIKRFQSALDEIREDMQIWKQGMTFATSHDQPHNNLLQPKQSIMFR